MPLPYPPDATAPRGNIRVLLNGRIFVGPDWRVMMVSVVLITVCSSLFVFYTNEVTAARVLVGVTALAAVLLLLLCGLSDPGVAPQRAPPRQDSPHHESLWRERTYIDREGRPHHTCVEIKWCCSCHNYRPYRGVHCRFCDRCVARRDHHCPWTGTCIGAKNYRSYFALVSILSITLVTAFVGGIESLVQRTIQHNKDASTSEESTSAFTAALVDTYCVELLLILLSFVFGLLTCTLAVHHAYLISQNLTSADAARELRVNTFTNGSVFANIAAAVTGWRCEEEGLSECHQACSEVVVEAGDAEEVGYAPRLSSVAAQLAACDTAVNADSQA